MLVLGLSGSLRAGSYNTALLHAARTLLAPAARLELYNSLTTVPPYAQDQDVDPAPPAVADLRARIAEADAILIATPEYNGSIPGQLKNAIDWASRPYPDSALRAKPVAVVGASTGLFGAVWAQADLRKVLTTAGARVLDAELHLGDAPAAFDEHLRLADAGVADALATILHNLLAHLEPVHRSELSQNSRERRNLAALSHLASDRPAAQRGTCPEPCPQLCKSDPSEPDPTGRTRAKLT